jgi:hypothetical protein
MALGPGKYDEVCTVAREACAAQGVILIVFGGSNGNGFCVQAPLEIQFAIPKILRDLADKIETDVDQFKSG